jgi:glyoxylase-like metal-dependent hydrolase (beta-lactamase superfamily II)
MEEVIRGLYASAPRRLRFSETLVMRAFLCRRRHGNVLVYGASDLRAEEGDLEVLGGVERHYLGHSHEAELTSTSPAGSSGTYVHERDANDASLTLDIGATFARRHVVDEDFEVIPTPGHTPGATAYLWESGECRALFSADTIFLRGGDWTSALLESSDRTSFAASLKLIRELDFDFLVPWIAARGQPCCARTDREDARRRIDAILERLRLDDGGPNAEAGPS